MSEEETILYKASDCEIVGILQGVLLFLGNLFKITNTESNCDILFESIIDKF